MNGMERNEDKMDTRELEDIQSTNEQRYYTTPNLMKLGKMQNLTLAGSKTGPLTDDGRPEQEV